MKRALSLLFLTFSCAGIHGQVEYPHTRKIAQTDVYHGVKIADPYRWLENDTSEATLAWVKAQNEVTFKYLSGIPFRETLRSRMVEVHNYPRYSAPFRNGGYYYFLKNDGLQNQSILYRQKGIEGRPEVVIDPNTFSKDGTAKLADFKLSKDGRYAAWAISRAGSDWHTLYIKDMATMKELSDSVNWVKVSEIAWQKNGFYYSRYPEPKVGMELSSINEDHQVWYHTLGTPQTEDKQVFEDKAHPHRFHIAYTTEDERYVFLSVSDGGGGHKGNALFYRDNRDTDKSFNPIEGEVGQFQYGVVEVVRGNKFLIYTNRDAPNSKVMLFDPAQPDEKKWTTIIPESSEPLESADLAGGRLFLRYLKDVAAKVYVHSIDGKRIREVKFPGPGNVEGFTGLKDDKFVFYTYTSLNFPTHIYRYNIATGKSILFRKPEILFNPEEYETKQEFYKSKDGTKIPMFIVHKKGVVHDGKNPTLLYGYGGFNITMSPWFSTSLIPWLELGGVYAVANLRGGSEYGEKWHEAGMLHNKQNVFDDFIAAAEYLIDKKYTSSEKLAIRGGSNGGLLVGAVMNQRPDLFRVAVPEVGVMDMLRFHRFTIGFNWIAEYGSSENEEDFRYLYNYSPLHNIKTGLNYPATMIVTADHDDRVVPAHSFKFAATLQEKYKGPYPQLIRIDTNSGHGASSIMKNIDLATDIYSFILFNMGVSQL